MVIKVIKNHENLNFPGVKFPICETNWGGISETSEKFGVWKFPPPNQNSHSPQLGRGIVP